MWCKKYGTMRGKATDDIVISFDGCKYILMLRKVGRRLSQVANVIRNVE